MVGDADVEAGTCGVNDRGSERPDRDVPVDDFVDRLRAEVLAKTMSLERLWAGWRAEYVADHAAGVADAVQTEGGSVFTRILASGAPDEETGIVWRGERVFAILNRFPYGTGHLLVMPYREVRDLESLDEDEFADLWSAVRSAVVAIKAAYAPDGVNIGANLGEGAGAGVPGHVHVHVLPRWVADSSFITAVAETRVLPESLPVDVAQAARRVAVILVDGPDDIGIAVLTLDRAEKRNALLDRAARRSVRRPGCAGERRRGSNP